jgi:hypothetical protein
MSATSFLQIKWVESLQVPQSGGRIFDGVQHVFITSKELVAASPRKT